jgi:hypothetical protein
LQVHLTPDWNDWVEHITGPLENGSEKSRAAAPQIRRAPPHLDGFDRIGQSFACAGIDRDGGPALNPMLRGKRWEKL